jgi:hypothetical protein
MGLDDGVQRAATIRSTGPGRSPSLSIRNFGSCAFIPRIVLHVKQKLQFVRSEFTRIVPIRRRTYKIWYALYGRPASRDRRHENGLQPRSDLPNDSERGNAKNCSTTAGEVVPYVSFWCRSGSKPAGVA